VRFFFALCAPANDRPGDATTGNVKPNHGTDCGIFCVSLSIAQEDRWTDATKRQGWMDSRGGARFENLNSFASDLKFARARAFRWMTRRRERERGLTKARARSG